jgi:hypothetical protein
MILLAGIGGLIPLLIFIAFGILSQWLKKKAARERADDFRDLPHGPQPRQQQRRRASWEDELREILEDHPAPPPIRRDVPPPVFAPAPPPIPEQEDRGIEVYLPAPQPKIEPAFQPVRGLAESEQRFAHAASLQERVGQHLAGISRRNVGMTNVERHAIAARTQEAINLVRDPKNVRNAILASVIIGPPRALDAY